MKLGDPSDELYKYPATYLLPEQRILIKDIPTSPLLLVLNSVLENFPRKKEITTLKK